MENEPDPNALHDTSDADPRPQQLTSSPVVRLVASVSALASDALPEAFINTLKKAIDLAPAEVQHQIEVRLQTTDESVPDFGCLQAALARIYVRAEVMKVEAKKPWVGVNVLIEGWSGCEKPSEFHGGRHGTVALGGTFDHLHAGHKILLTMAAWLATKRVIVGITDDNLLVNKKFKSELQSLPERTASVRAFLRLISPLALDISTPALQDVYGPTATEPDIQAILISRETLSGADAIDNVREDKGLGKLERFVIDVISSSEVCLKDDEGLKDLKMSSTEIRRWLHSQHTRPAAPPSTDPSN